MKLSIILLFFALITSFGCGDAATKRIVSTEYRSKDTVRRYENLGHLYGQIEILDESYLIWYDNLKSDTAKTSFAKRFKAVVLSGKKLKHIPEKEQLYQTFPKSFE